MIVNIFKLKFIFDMKKRDKLNPVIYCITNLVNNKKYVGSATRDKERWRGHRSLLRRGLHFSSHLQSAWNKYGADNFEFSILQNVEYENLTNEQLTEKLIKLESEWIIKLNTTDRTLGYNTREDCSTNLGIKWSEESKKRFSEKKKGIPVPHLREAAIRNWQDPNFRERHIKLIQEKNKLRTKEEKELIAKKRSNALKTFYEKQLAENGFKTDPAIIKKSIETGIKNGVYKSIYAYFPDGKFFKKFLTVADALRFLDLPSGNTSSLKSIVDKYFYKGLIWSFMEFKKYPKKQLKLITNSPQRRNFLCVSKNGEIKVFDINKDVSSYVNINPSAFYKRLATIIHEGKDYFSINDFEIYIFAPILSNMYSKLGEFIKTLYFNKDNNEPSLDLNGQERCND